MLNSKYQEMFLNVGKAEGFRQIPHIQKQWFERLSTYVAKYLCRL